MDWKYLSPPHAATLRSQWPIFSRQAEGSKLSVSVVWHMCAVPSWKCRILMKFQIQIIRYKINLSFVYLLQMLHNENSNLICLQTLTLYWIMADSRGNSRKNTETNESSIEVSRKTTTQNLIQGYLFCSFAELNNSAKNSKNYEKWKETTKFTRDLSRFWIPKLIKIGKNGQNCIKMGWSCLKWPNMD